MAEFARIPKNKREEIRISRETFKGTDLVNVRVFFDAGEGEMRPGKQGVAFRTSLLPDVLDALTKASEMEAAA